MKTGDASAHNLLSYSLLFAFSHNVFPNRITNRTRNTGIKLYRYEVTTIAVKKIQLGMVLEPITEKSPNPSFSQIIPAGSQTKVKRIASTLSGRSSKK